jgi:hypothetical protein
MKKKNTLGVGTKYTSSFEDLHCEKLVIIGNVSQTIMSGMVLHMASKCMPRPVGDLPYVSIVYYGHTVRNGQFARTCIHGHFLTRSFKVPSLL